MHKIISTNSMNKHDLSKTIKTSTNKFSIEEKFRNKKVSVKTNKK